MVPIILAAAFKHRQTYSPNLSHVSGRNAGLTSPTNPKCWVKSYVTSRHRVAHKCCQNSAQRRTWGIKSSTDVLRLSTVSQQRYVEWRNGTCVRQQAVISPFWSAGRQQQQQSDDTALADRADCLAAWQHIGLTPPFFSGRRPEATSACSASPMWTRHLWPRENGCSWFHSRHPAMNAITHAHPFCNTVLVDRRRRTMPNRRLVNVSIYLTVPELDWQRTQDNMATKFLNMTTHYCGGLPLRRRYQCPVSYS